MSLPRTWHRENYAEPYWLSVTGTEATSITGEAKIIPAVLYSVTLAAHTSLRVRFFDASSTANALSATASNIEKEKLEVFVVASGTHHLTFPRGLVFDKGIIVSAVGGASDTFSITYHPEYL